MVDAATGAAIADEDNNAVSVVVPSSSTKDDDAYVGALVPFKGACVGAFADGTGPLSNDDNIESAVGKGGGGGSLAPWGTRTVASPVDSIVSGDAIIVAIIVVVVVLSHAFYRCCHRRVAAMTSIAVAVTPSITTVAVPVTAAPSIAVGAPHHRCAIHHLSWGALTPHVTVWAKAAQLHG